jgi:hypothetical protein
MADYGIQIGKVFFIGLLSVILTLDIVVGLQALYYWQLDRTETADELYQPPKELTALLYAQRAQLADYRVVDAKKGIVSIPINRAMELVVAELSRHGGDATSSRGDMP